MSSLPETLFFKVSGKSAPDLHPGDNLPPGWSLKQLSSHREKQVFYDTFEDQAFQKGLAVMRNRGKLCVTELDAGTLLAEEKFSSTPASFFATSLPAGKTRELLERCSDLRAFIRICSIDTVIASWRIMDGNDKTIAILNSESMHLADETDSEAFAEFYAITPLKGYHKELAIMLKALPEHVDAYRIVGFRERFLMIMAAAKHDMLSYSSKLLLQLDREASIHENARRLLRFTTSVMRMNEAGIRKEIDTEFLHDYRVALRRSRSILRQLKGVFDPQETAWFLTGLRDLGKQTNQLRDGDVYLLHRDCYAELLPPFLRPSLDEFFGDIATARKLQQKLFCSYLSSPVYTEFMEAWEKFIGREELPDPEKAPRSALPTREVAESSVRKAWKKVIVHGRRIGREATDAELHQLRIDCKKLRYLLEFFSSLFPEKTAARVVRQLKELQDNLGEFVDLSVQLDFLKQRLESRQAVSGSDSQTAAIGGLVAVLYQKQEESRLQFHETFTKFDDDGTREMFDELVTSLQ
jgi:CHAD domain-containing protein